MAALLEMHESQVANTLPHTHEQIKRERGRIAHQQLPSLRQEVQADRELMGRLKIGGDL